MLFLITVPNSFFSQVLSFRCIGEKHIPLIGRDIPSTPSSSLTYQMFLQQDSGI